MTIKIQERGIDFSFPNGRSGDPVVYGFNHRTGEAFLFDLGGLDRVSQRKLLKVRRVFVSHTHIDHFVGFDRLLRINIPQYRQLEFCGPPGIVANIRGKLAGYMWNLLEKHQLKFLLHEIETDGHISSYKLEFEQGDFRLSPYPQLSHTDGVITTFADGSKVRATLVDHGIPVASYRLCLPPRYQVKTAALTQHDLKPGPWLKELLTALTNENGPEKITVEGKNYSVAWLQSAILQSYPKSAISYLTDLRFNWENLTKIKKLHQDATVLFCESTFKAIDWQRAVHKAHLSTRQCALLAAYTGVHRLENFHFSRIYGPKTETLRNETLRYFLRYRQLTAAQLQKQIDLEMEKIATTSPTVSSGCSGAFD